MATKKETIKPPTQKTVKAASKEMRGGSSPGGRVMADKSVAVKQGVIKAAPKKR